MIVRIKNREQSKYRKPAQKARDDRRSVVQMAAASAWRRRKAKVTLPVIKSVEKMGEE